MSVWADLCSGFEGQTTDLASENEWSRAEIRLLQQLFSINFMSSKLIRAKSVKLMARTNLFMIMKRPDWCPLLKSVY
ncbi:MAG: hypothetical protein CMP10_19675 [Zetaproteobacteria bacterium]|nr:hypothetical protein [Pseudobdellovibrionaceae bacterium]